MRAESENKQLRFLNCSALLVFSYSSLPGPECYFQWPVASMESLDWKKPQGLPLNFYGGLREQGQEGILLL